MKFSIFLVLLSIVFVFSLGITNVWAETFGANLTIGSKGTDVTQLQQFLVSKGFLVMPLGVSYGYFGPLTRSAVAKWQEVNGITPASGYFGPVSRGVIARQMTVAVPDAPDARASSTESLVSDTPAVYGLKAGQIMLFRAFPYEARPGDLVALDGSGFSRTSNKIYFNGGNEIVAASSDGANLEITVPTNLNDGDYRLSVSNTLGSSLNPDFKVMLRVTKNPQSAPSIEKASIDGDIVTITGSGFTSSNNLITTLGDSAGSLSSSGATITFRLADLSRYSQTQKFTRGKYKASLWIYVQNEHGVSKDPYELKITI